jgi:hypothetical protein
MTHLQPACLECGNPATEDAHLIPRVRGGTATVPLCGPCHGRMHDVDRAQDLGTLTREGLARARAAGVRLGAPRTASAATLEAAVAAYRETGGWSAAARRLAEGGVPTPRGGKWYPASVRALVMSQDGQALAAVAC